ncbi:MlaA family lipoprotein [Cellvibrio polysaccharolyticus]|nr:VacJ family lipoprotein [Cellvibrio polysaccharolyticus]
MAILKSILPSTLGATLMLSVCLPVMANEEQDRWQGYNRAMYSFNTTVDKYTLKPLAKGYVYVTPSVVRKGVSNVFFNIREVPSALNGLLQGKPGSAARDTGRFLINSTVGLLGIFDVASRMGIPSSGHEDFGQTLAVWGVGQGPYVVLPFLGPSTLRDSFALPADWYTDPRTYVDNVRVRNTLTGLNLVNVRANLFELEQHITGDQYTFVRDAYLQHRNYLILDGAVTDDFGMDDDFADDIDFE